MSPRISTVAIIGVGLIGGSFGMALKKRGLAERVVGIGRSPERLQRAVDLGAVDCFSTDLAAASQADLIYVATPVGLELDFIRRVVPFAKPGAVITDAGSTKAEICRGADDLLSEGVSFVGAHPMAGSEATGVEAGSPDLFVGAAYVLTPTETTDPDALLLVRSLAEGIGSRVFVMDPDAHDECVAVISHLPHLMAAALVMLAEARSASNPEVLQLVAGSFRDMTRVAGSSPELWRDICMTNPYAIARSVADFKRLLDEGLGLIEANDPAGFEKWFRSGKDFRSKLTPTLPHAHAPTRRLSIAIDGPAGAGKTTVAREVARRLGYKYVDTGAMYRAVALKSIEEGIPLSDEDRIIEMTGRMNIDFTQGDGSRITVDGVDVSKEIRTPEVTKLSSPVSAISGVRRLLVAQQRRLAGEGGVVMEGRDIGSVVLPDAEVKVLLTASVNERARRRYAEMKAAAMDADLEMIKREIEERDYRDSTRADSPLIKAPGAVEIDTDCLTIDQAVQRIMDLVHSKTNVGA